MASTAPTAALVAQPLWRRWTGASFLARWPVTMSLVALVFAGEAVTGSLAVGAQLAGVATAANGLASPWRARRRPGPPSRCWSDSARRWSSAPRCPRPSRWERCSWSLACRWRR